MGSKTKPFFEALGISGGLSAVSCVQAQIVNIGLEAARPYPALRHLVDSDLVREGMRQHPPRRAGADQPAYGIDDALQRKHDVRCKASSLITVR